MDGNWFLWFCWNHFCSLWQNNTPYLKSSGIFDFVSFWTFPVYYVIIFKNIRWRRWHTCKKYVWKSNLHAFKIYLKIVFLGAVLLLVVIHLRTIETNRTKRTMQKYYFNHSVFLISDSGSKWSSHCAILGRVFSPLVCGEMGLSDEERWSAICH